MANLIVGLIEVLEQELRLQRVRNPTQEAAVIIKASDIAAIIRPEFEQVYVIPVKTLVKRLKEQLVQQT